MKNSSHLKLRALCEGAIFVALAQVLGYIKLFELPQGGSVGIGMLPIFIYCARWGCKESFLASFAYGLLQLIFDGAYAWGPTSMLFDYVLAYGVLGVACLFRKQKDKLELMRAQYGKAETSVNRIVSELEKHQVTLMKDIAMLDQMYELNLKYYKELTMYIIAGKKRLAEVRSGELEELRKKAEASGLAEDAQAYNDYAQKCERFEKKLHDLELTRMVSLQMGPQTRLLQNNDTLIVEKIQSSLVNTIPLWKSQMVLALGMEHSRQATAAQSAVAQTTNELLKKNADMLKMGTIATAKEAERSIVDIETLQHTNEQLVSTLDEVVNIQREGAQKRKEAEVELGRIEGELKQKLMELRS